MCFLFPIHLGLHRAYHIFTTIIHEGARLALLTAGGSCTAHAAPLPSAYTCRAQPVLTDPGRCWKAAHKQMDTECLVAACALCLHACCEIAPWIPWAESPTSCQCSSPQLSASPCRPHTGGHAGYEIAPFIPSIESLVALLLLGRRPCGALNTVRHHDMHHRYPPYHFSLYMCVLLSASFLCLQVLVGSCRRFGWRGVCLRCYPPYHFSLYMCVLLWCTCQCCLGAVGSLGGVACACAATRPTASACPRAWVGRLSWLLRLRVHGLIVPPLLAAVVVYARGLLVLLSALCLHQHQHAARILAPANPLHK